MYVQDSPLGVDDGLRAGPRGTLDSATRFVPRSGASPLGCDDSSSTSKVDGEPARAASALTTLSTSRDGDGVDGPVSAASRMRCASPSPAEASPTEMRSFASRRPDVTRDSSDRPSTPTTMTESTRVVAVTRSHSERRQIRARARGTARKNRATASGSESWSCASVYAGPAL